MTQRKRIGIAVPVHIYEKLKCESEYTGQTLNALIRQILRDWLDAQK